MKKYVTIAAAIVCALSVALFAVNSAAVNSSAADSLKKQDITYDELVGRVNQSDSGFTIGSTTAKSSEMSASTAPFTGTNATGFQFYYLGLEKWSSNNKGTDGAIEQWYLDWLDATLTNLRKNGGSCIIRACYAIGGESNAEPSSFEILQQHQEQLANVFKNYPDVIVGVECGMAGQYGEMHHGLYSENGYKNLILDKWLTTLPENITVNVRTLDEYIYYINHSETYKNKYMNKTVNGVAYPEKITNDNCASYLFENEIFNRIGFYNDGMIQDGNDAGTFCSSRSDFVKLLNSKSDRISYGGEFSGASGEMRFERDTWMPLNAITEFYNVHLSYYHGGNAAYSDTGKYKTGQTYTATYTSSTVAAQKAQQFKDWCASLGSGMTYSATQSGTKVSYSVGGWKSSTVGDALINKLQTDANVTADLSAYKGKTVAAFFEDHLGYRLVLKESYLTEKAGSGGTLTVKGVIDNTGFTNISREKKAELILSDNADGDNMYILELDDLDVSSWTGGSRNEYNMTLSLPADIKAGTYQVYLRIASKDSPASCIRFANPGQFSNKVQGSWFAVGDATVNIIYNPKVCGNYIGSIAVE